MVKKIAIKNPNEPKKQADDWVLHREGNKRLTLDLPESLHARLKILSVKKKTTMGDIVRTCLNEKVGELEKED